MIPIRRGRIFAMLLVSVAAVSGCAGPPPAAEWNLERHEVQTPGLVCFGSRGIYVSNQPTEAGFAELEAIGVRTVINLRPSEEQRNFDEKTVVETLGLAYVHKPVSTQTLDDRSVDEVLVAIQRASPPVLLHDLSGSRAAGLWALHAVEAGQLSPGEALELADAGGLRQGKMRSFVEARLAREDSAAREKDALPPRPEEEASP
jgi:uncharacterized protein (TIGR01244 family)